MLIISFDMNTDGPNSRTARKIFEDTLEARGWRNEIHVGGTIETLPDTTRVAERAPAEAKRDVHDAEAAAGGIESLFILRKYVISEFVRVDSRSDDRRPVPNATMRDTIERSRR